MELDRHDHEQYMALALEQARLAAIFGEVPVGAVLVRGNEILAKNFNRREMEGNPLSHAEMAVIHEAARHVKSWRLTETTLYVTLEPCLMCAGAIIQARIPHLVFGASDPKAGACGSVLNAIDNAKWNHRVHVLSGVQADSCSHILHQFFKDLRENESKHNTQPAS